MSVAEHKLLEVHIKKRSNIMRFDGPQKVQAQARLQIREGMTVAEVKKYGSEGQKLAASLFDSDRVKNEKGDFGKDGIFNKQEAEMFNNYNFSVRDGLFTMYDRKSGQITEIKYDNIEDLKNLLNDEWNEPGCMLLDKNGKRRIFLGNATEGGKITLDLTNTTVTADGVKGKYICASGEKVIVKNSDVGEVNTHAKELEIKNTKDKGLIYDSSTRLEVGKDTMVKIDDTSDCEISRDEQ